MKNLKQLSFDPQLTFLKVTTIKFNVINAIKRIP